MEHGGFTFFAVLTSAALACWALTGPGATVAMARVPERVPATPPDFNGDGDADLAVGAPGNNRGNGIVNVIPGGPHGPRGKASTAGVQGASPVRPATTTTSALPSHPDHYAGIW